MNCPLNELRVIFYPDRRMTKTGNLFQHDYGQILHLAGFPLPDIFEVHFSHVRNGESITVMGKNERVQIPDMFLESGKTIYAWLYLHNGLTDGRTVYEIVIPVTERPGIHGGDPTPVEQDIISEAIAALSNAVAETTAIRDEIKDLIDIFDPGTEKDKIIVDAGTTADIEDETVVTA